jgi:hypothetical protein
MDGVLHLFFEFIISLVPYGSSRHKRWMTSFSGFALASAFEDERRG